MKIEWVHPLFSFGPFKRVKRLQNASKTLIFRNWLDTCHKKETHEPKLYFTILGGVSRDFWTPFLDLGARSAISEPFHPLYEAKISNRCQSVVYGSITLKFFSGALGTSPHQWFNRRNEIQRRCFFWDTLVERVRLVWTHSTLKRGRREEKVERSECITLVCGCFRATTKNGRKEPFLIKMYLTSIWMLRFLQLFVYEEERPSHCSSSQHLSYFSPPSSTQD